MYTKPSFGYWPKSHRLMLSLVSLVFHMVCKRTEGGNLADWLRVMIQLRSLSVRGLIGCSACLLFLAVWYVWVIASVIKLLTSKIIAESCISCLCNYYFRESLSVVEKKYIYTGIYLDSHRVYTLHTTPQQLKSVYMRQSDCWKSFELCVSM